MNEQAPTPQPHPILPAQAGYDRWADIYDDDLNPLIHLEERYFSSLVGAVSNVDVIDMGCGTGRHATRLANAGARVTAVDFSDGMVHRASEKPGWERVRFLAHDLATPVPLPKHTFDVVISCLVLDHIHDLVGAFAEFKRLCRPGGAVVVTVMHPAMMLKGVQARFIDRSSGQRIQLASATHQISDYVNAALASNLAFTRFSEHSADMDLVRSCPRAEKYVGWPLLMIMKCVPGAE